jgi:hypothetical protein
VHVSAVASLSLCLVCCSPARKKERKKKEEEEEEDVSNWLEHVDEPSHP